jgi:preprotein translocase subunit Sec61beta
MAQDRITTPSSSAGLVRFSEATVSNVLVDPEVIIAVAAAVIFVEIALHFVSG